MGHLDYLKASFWLLIALAVLLAIGFIVYELRKAGGGIANSLKRVTDYISPPDPVMPPNLKKFVDEAVNQPGGYTPWKPAEEVDDTSWMEGL
jgi:hypothetical protein